MRGILNTLSGFFRLVLPIVGPILVFWAGGVRDEHGIWRMGVLSLVLLALGTCAALFGLVLNEMAISRVQAERVLDAAVDFIRGAGATDVRANFAKRKRLRPKHLKMKYYSYNYGDDERANTWKPKDGACATTALERGVPVLGGYRNELIPKESIGVHFAVAIQEMAVLGPKERTRSVLCVPVRRRGMGFHNYVGVVTFDDHAKLTDSTLKEPGIVHAARELALRGLERG